MDRKIILIKPTKKQVLVKLEQSAKMIITMYDDKFAGIEIPNDKTLEIMEKFTSFDELLEYKRRWIKRLIERKAYDQIAYANAMCMIFTYNLFVDGL